LRNLAVIKNKLTPEKPDNQNSGAAETTLLSDSTIKEYHNTVAGTIEECDRLLDMINTMLDISEAETGAIKLRREEIDIANVVYRACDLFEPIADNKGVTLNANISTPCYVWVKRNGNQVI